MLKSGPVLSNVDDYYEYYVVGCDAMKSGRNLSMFLTTLHVVTFQKREFIC